MRPRWFLTASLAVPVGLLAGVARGQVITEFPVPSAFGGALGITAGFDGNLWFTEQSANKIGRITTAGVITEFPLPVAGTQPARIITGPDGGLWFTETGRSFIGHITPTGSFTEIPLSRSGDASRESPWGPTAPSGSPKTRGIGSGESASRVWPPRF